ncbi:MAG TPA: hypothetical protein VN018_02035 [Brevundimonas sp.]|nr:hypothetical protein [Brevundimonas sp.]
MRTILIVAAGLGLAGCGGAGGVSQPDLKCYALSSLILSGPRGNADAAASMAYYMGRLDGADPSGDWAKAMPATRAALTALPEAELRRLVTECGEGLTASVARQRAVDA